MIKLMVADDHTIVRDGLRMLFSRTDDIQIAEEATNGNQVLELLRHTTVDLVVLDIAMPHVNGTDLVLKVLAKHPGLPILILSMYNEPQIALDFIAAGVSGYITKDSDPTEILSAVRAVATGKRYLPPDIAEKLAFFQIAPNAAMQNRQLSEREMQVLKLLAKGQSIREIAQTLFISHKTVSSHKARIMQKISCATNLQLMQYAIKHNLVERPV
jgi:DNA-binding NarL/FixJ family response regulator